MALVADTSLPGSRVGASSMPSSPARQAATCVSDNGTELTGMAMLRLARKGRSTGTNRAGQTAPERVHRELQRPAARRILNETLFSSLAEARAVLAAWKDDYKTPGRTVPWATSHDRIRQSQRSRAATGRDAALCEGSAPRPVAPPSPLGSNVTGILPIAG